MQVLSSLSSIPFYAPSAGFAPTNSADVSAIASAYQVVSATATQLYAGTAYVTSVNDAPISAARAGNAANASLSNSAWYDGTGRLISALPDSAAVSAIASSYVESGVSSKQDTLSFAYNTADQISSINGSALGGMDEAAVSGIASAYAESAVSSVSGNYYTTANESGFLTAQAQASWSESASASPSYIVDKPDLVDIVAGPGIVIDNPDGNTLRVSTDENYETVLWSNDEGTDTRYITWSQQSLSEDISHFGRVKFLYNGDNAGNGEWHEFDVVSGGYYTLQSVSVLGIGGIAIRIAKFSLSGTSITNDSNVTTNRQPGGTWDANSTTGYNKLYRIVGLNRISGGN